MSSTVPYGLQTPSRTNYTFPNPSLSVFGVSPMYSPGFFTMAPYPSYDIARVPISPYVPSVFNTPRSTVVENDSTPDLGCVDTPRTANLANSQKKSLNKFRKEYCFECNIFIRKEGQRSQGPRRHIIQHHMRVAQFQCPHCAHDSVYDKYHVTMHMKRMHGDTSGKVIVKTQEAEAEMKRWYKECFRLFSPSLDSTENTEKQEDEEEEENGEKEEEVVTPPPSLHQPSTLAQTPPETPVENGENGRKTPENSEKLLPYPDSTPLCAPNVSRKRTFAFSIENLIQLDQSAKTRKSGVTGDSS